MDLNLLLAIAGGLVVGAVAALKIIAPRTSNTKDDAVLAQLERVESALKTLLGLNLAAKKDVK